MLHYILVTPNLKMPCQSMSTNAASLKCSVFRKKSPELWFPHVEAQFDIKNIIADQTISITLSAPQIYTLRMRSKVSRRIHQLLTNIEYWYINPKFNFFYFCWHINLRRISVDNMNTGLWIFLHEMLTLHTWDFHEELLAFLNFKLIM